MLAKRRSGMIIRLVDIVLIILFGFLMISEIQRQQQIELPKSASENEDPRNEQYFFVYVYANGDIRPGNYRSLTVNMPLQIRSDAWRDVYADLKAKMARGNPEKKPVAIMTECFAPSQYVVNVIDACQELDFRHFIRVEASLEKRGAS